MTAKTITTETGTTVSLKPDGSHALVVLDNPSAPDGMRDLEAGRVVNGAFQAAMFMDFALRPSVLRAIATLIEEG